MPRRGNQYIELSGPIFGDDLERLAHDAIAEGIQELGDDAVGIMMSHIQAGGLIDTGRLLRSVDDPMIRTGGAIGYVKVAPTAVWPEPDRPTRTWIARGVRSGKKLRKQYDIFSRTATRTRQIDQTFIANKLAEALNG